MTAMVHEEADRKRLHKVTMRLIKRASKGKNVIKAMKPHMILVETHLMMDQL